MPHYYSSSTASSVYSQDGVIFPAPYDSSAPNGRDSVLYNKVRFASVLYEPNLQPLLERKESSASVLSKSSKASSKASNISQASTLAPTIYTEEIIKQLGYRPFEYWKGPPPVAHDLVHAKDDGKKKRLPVPPPPKALHRRSRAIRNSMRALASGAGSGSRAGAGAGAGALPPARLRDSMLPTLHEKPAARAVPPRPPPSPRVKDRYKYRYKLPRKNGEWPGWEPDEAVVRYFATRFAAVQEEKKEKGYYYDDDDDDDDEKLLLEKVEYRTTTRSKSKKSTSSSTTKPAKKAQTKGSKAANREKKSAKRKQKDQKRRHLWYKASPSSSSSSAKTSASRTRRRYSDTGSLRLWGEQERLWKPSTWRRRSWSLVTLLSMLVLGLILILVAALPHNNGEIKTPALARALSESETVVMARRAVHGGALFRFGAIRHDVP